MQIKDVRPESFTKQIRCDRCARLFEFGDTEFRETASIDLKAGYGSIFGDGNSVQIDLCQHCLKLTLARWLRIVESGQHARAIERLSLFDPERHGGEFPTSADISVVAPEKISVTERQPLDVETSKPKRQVGFLAGRLEVPDDFDEPLPPQVAGAFEEIGTDDLIDRSPDVSRRTWNYRVMSFQHGEDAWQAIHEVHYQDGVPIGYSATPADVMWDLAEREMEGGLLCLERMKEALLKPVLTEADFAKGEGRAAEP